MTEVSEEARTKAVEAVQRLAQGVIDRTTKEVHEDLVAIEYLLRWRPPVSATLDPEPMIDRATGKRFALADEALGYRFWPRRKYVQDRAAYEPAPPRQASNDHADWDADLSDADDRGLSATPERMPDDLSAAEARQFPWSAMAEREALRERIAEAMFETDQARKKRTAAHGGWYAKWDDPLIEGTRVDYREKADAVLAVLPSREAETEVRRDGCVVCGGPLEFVDGGEWAGFRCADTSCSGYESQHIVLASRSTVAPTEEQIAGVLLHVMNDYQARDETTSKAEFCGSQARAVLALLPGESREAVEAKARAEVIDWMEDDIESMRSNRYRNAREHFGIGDDRG